MRITDKSNRVKGRSFKCLLPVVVSAVFVTGCMPQASNTDGGAEEYQYKGKPDPLMSEPAANRAGKLSERFKLIQARQ